MALFGGKKKTEVKADAPKVSKVKAAKKAPAETAPKPTAPAAVKSDGKHASNTQNFTSMILGPRITEKASMVSEKNNSYVFNVHSSATKIAIAKAVSDIYNVTPTKVHIVKVPAKNVISRGRAGVKSGGKKAYVYLKTGDKIEIM